MLDIKLFHLKLLLAFSIFLISIITALPLFFINRQVSLNFANLNLSHYQKAEYIAAGIFLGVGFLDMLPDAANIFTKIGYHYPIGYLIASTTFLFMLLLEHIVFFILPKQENHYSFIAILLTLFLSVHSILEGAALGLSDSILSVMLIAIAILSHKGAASFALSLKIFKAKLRKALSYSLFMIFAFMTPVGILLGHSLMEMSRSQESIIGIFNSLAAGTFIYIGTLHGLESAILVKKNYDLRNYMFVLAGFFLIAIVAIYS